MEQNEIDYFGRMIAEGGRAVAPQEHPQTIITRLRATLAERDAEIERLRGALTRLRDCDWTITLPDRMDGVRDIARAALQTEA